MAEIAEDIVARVPQIIARDIDAAVRSAATTTRWTSCAASFAQLLSDDWAHGVEAAVDMALLGRYYERFADHAVSVATGSSTW